MIMKKGVHCRVCGNYLYLEYGPLGGNTVCSLCESQITCDCYGNDIKINFIGSLFDSKVVVKLEGGITKVEIDNSILKNRIKKLALVLQEATRKRFEKENINFGYEINERTLRV